MCDGQAKAFQKNARDCDTNSGKVNFPIVPHVESWLVPLLHHATMSLCSRDT